LVIVEIRIQKVNTFNVSTIIDTYFIIHKIDANSMAQFCGSYNKMLAFTDVDNFKTTQQQQQQVKEEQPHTRLADACPEQRIATAVRSFCAAGTDERALLADDLGCGFG
jgi:hypothetical protein